MTDSELRVLCLSICLISQMGLLRPRQERPPQVHKASQYQGWCRNQGCLLQDPGFLCHRTLLCELRPTSALLWCRGALYVVPLCAVPG